MLNFLRKKRYVVNALAPSTNATGSIYTISNYTALSILKATNSLIPGMKYRFTYNSIYRQLHTALILTGPDETLVITATSNNTFDTQAKSIEYPFDEITYIFDDLSAEDGTTPRPGFIWKRKNTLNQNSTPFDFRTILFRRFPLNTAAIPNFIAANNYLKYEFIKNANKIYYCTKLYLSTANFSNDLALGYWQELVNYSNSPNLSPTPTIWAFTSGILLPVDSGGTDYTIFDESNFTVCNNIEIEEYSPGERFNCNTVFIDAQSYLNIFLSSVCNENTFYREGSNDIRMQGIFANNLVSASTYINTNQSSVATNCSLIRCTFLEFIGTNALITLENCDFMTTINSGECYLKSLTYGEINNSGSLYARDVSFSRFKNLFNVKFIPLPSSGYVDIINTKNKIFSGSYYKFTFNSPSENIALYTNNYSNKIADVTSPLNAVFFPITDEGGTVTYEQIS